MFNNKITKDCKDWFSACKSLKRTQSTDQFALPSSQTSVRRRNTEVKASVANYISPHSQSQRSCSPSDLFCNPQRPPGEQYNSDGEQYNSDGERYNSDGEIDYHAVLTQKLKAKEREESKNWEKVFQCFSFCQTEIKNVCTQVNQLVEKDSGETGNIAVALEKVFLEISKSSSDLQRALETRENCNGELLKLQLDLQKEKSKNEELEHQLAMLRSELEKLRTEELQRAFFEGCEDIKDCVYNHFQKLQQDLEKQSCALESRYTDLHHQTILAGQSQVQETCKVLVQMERSLTLHMDQNSSTQKEDESRFHKDLQDQLIEINRQHREEVKLLFKQQLQHIQQEGSKQYYNFQQHETELQNLQNKHMTAMQNFIENQALQSANVPQQEIRKVVEDIFEQEKQKEHMLLKHQHEKIVQDMQRKIALQFEHQRHLNEHLRRQYYGDSSVPSGAASQMGVRSVINKRGPLNAPVNTAVQDTFSPERPLRYNPSEYRPQAGSEERLRTMELSPSPLGVLNRTLDAKVLFRQPQCPDKSATQNSADATAFTMAMTRNQQASNTGSLVTCNQVTSGLTTPLQGAPNTGSHVRGSQLQERAAIPVTAQAHNMQPQEKMIAPCTVAPNMGNQSRQPQLQNRAVTPLTVAPNMRNQAHGSQLQNRAVTSLTCPPHMGNQARGSQLQNRAVTPLTGPPHMGNQARGSQLQNRAVVPDAINAIKRVQVYTTVNGVITPVGVRNVTQQSIVTPNIAWGSSKPNQGVRSQSDNGPGYHQNLATESLEKRPVALRQSSLEVPTSIGQSVGSQLLRTMCQTSQRPVDRHGTQQIQGIAHAVEEPEHQQIDAPAETTNARQRHKANAASSRGRVGAGRKQPVVPEASSTFQNDTEEEEVDVEEVEVTRKTRAKAKKQPAQRKRQSSSTRKRGRPPKNNQTDQEEEYNSPAKKVYLRTRSTDGAQHMKEGNNSKRVNLNTVIPVMDSKVKQQTHARTAAVGILRDEQWKRTVNTNKPVSIKNRRSTKSSPVERKSSQVPSSRNQDEDSDCSSGIDVQELLEGNLRLTTPNTENNERPQRRCRRESVPDYSLYYRW